MRIESETAENDKSKFCNELLVNWNKYDNKGEVKDLNDSLLVPDKIWERNKSKVGGVLIEVRLIFE